MENELNQRQKRIRVAIRLEIITIAWMLMEAAGSIISGVVANSMLLMAFGMDSVIELASALLLYWRLAKEANDEPDELEHMEAIETKASRISGYMLLCLSVYVVLQSCAGLIYHHKAEPSYIGLTIAVIAALGMPVLAKAKIRIAEKIGSKALRADAMETITCGYLSWVLLTGLLFNILFHLWWLDNVAALVLVPFLINEGREAINGECSCHADES